MKLCDYGCGQEAKYSFKNGKWCCSKHWTKCSFQQKKKSIQIKEAWEDPDSGLNSILCKEKQSIAIKKAWEDPESGLNSDLRNNKISNKKKKEHKDPNSKYNSSSYRKYKSNNMKKLHKDPTSVFNSNLYREKLSNNMRKLRKDPTSKYNSTSYKEKQSKSHKLTIEEINTRYPFFSKIEEMRYNPDNSNEKEIQVHCKNHKCENSKEKGGWFTPTGTQLAERIRQLESKDGNGGSYLYCSQYCKDTCSLYNIQSDPYRDNTKPHTSEELEVFNKHILKRDNEICYYCGEHTATIVHHLRPQKLEPFFALDPDYAISVCKKCHYKYGHPTGSPYSTGNLAKIVCSVESQKFLNQTLEDIS